MKEIILLKHGELALKGLNRHTFEELLMKSIRRRLAGLGRFGVTTAQSTVTVEPLEESADTAQAFERLKCVFGIAGLSRAAAVEKDIGVILPAACEYMRGELSAARTFKVEAKRADKKFPLASPEICRLTGEALLGAYPHLTVDVHDPDVTVTVEIRDEYAFIHGSQQKGAGGMPLGSAGKAAVLISGGIDSPVAAWMMAKRGLELVAVHFASPPYTGEMALQKVFDLLSRVARYSGRITLFVVPFAEIQEHIRDCCHEELFTLVMRRFMMRIASDIAAEEHCGALITGESVGQVASQTIQAIACTDAAARLPVFRPLIGMDKEDVISIARRIGTFDISTLPYEDCCTVFTPKHPRTRPQIALVEKAEEPLDVDGLVGRALAGKTVHAVHARGAAAPAAERKGGTLDGGL